MEDDMALVRNDRRSFVVLLFGLWVMLGNRTGAVGALVGIERDVRIMIAAGCSNGRSMPDVRSEDAVHA